MARYPGITDRRSIQNIDQVVSLADIAPTFLDMANIPYETDHFTGKSLMPLLKEDPLAIRNHVNEIYTQTIWKRALWDTKVRDDIGMEICLQRI